MCNKEQVSWRTGALLLAIGFVTFFLMDLRTTERTTLPLSVLVFDAVATAGIACATLGSFRVVRSQRLAVVVLVAAKVLALGSAVVINVVIRSLFGWGGHY